MAASASPTRTSAAPTDPATTADNGSIVPPTGPGVAAGPLPDRDQIPADSGGIPVALYIMGALLVGVGGVILWMLFRQRPQAAAATGFPTGNFATPTGEFDSPPPNLGYPAGRAGAGPRPPMPGSASARRGEPAADRAAAGAARLDPPQPGAERAAEPAPTGRPVGDPGRRRQPAAARLRLTAHVRLTDTKEGRPHRDRPSCFASLPVRATSA